MLQFVNYGGIIGYFKIMYVKNRLICPIDVMCVLVQLVCSSEDAFVFVRMNLK
jgi:hypothetical protein